MEDNKDGAASRVAPTKENKIKGPYARARLSPDKDTFKQLAEVCSQSILDIGCGEKPRLSWELRANELWVGCDPAIKHPGTSILVHKGPVFVDKGAELVVFPDYAADIPQFYPDILSAVAPNQKDIVEGNIFNDQLERFLSQKKQAFIVVLDQRTREEAGYQREAMQAISQWMGEHQFKPGRENSAWESFRANSADLGATNIRAAFVRNV